MTPFQFPELAFKVTSQVHLKITLHTIRSSARHKLLNKWFPAGAVLASFDSFERLHIRLGVLR